MIPGHSWAANQTRLGSHAPTYLRYLGAPEHQVPSSPFPPTARLPPPPATWPLLSPPLDFPQTFPHLPTQLSDSLLPPFPATHPWSFLHLPHLDQTCSLCNGPHGTSSEHAAELFPSRDPYVLSFLSLHASFSLDREPRGQSEAPLTLLIPKPPRLTGHPAAVTAPHPSLVLCLIQVEGRLNMAGKSGKGRQGLTDLDTLQRR